MDGEDFGMLWSSCCPLVKHFTRVDLRGRRVGGIVDLPGDGSFSQEMVWTGSEYGAAWAQADFEVPGDSREPTFSWSGSRYGVVYLDEACDAIRRIVSLSVVRCICEDVDDRVWFRPDEVHDLRFASSTELRWSEPAGSGANRRLDAEVL